MKKTLGVWITTALLLINAGFLQGAPVATGQEPPVQTKEVPPPTPFAVTMQDGNSRVWERTVYELAPSGQIVPKKHHYNELATGLNYQQNGQWMASKEEIDIQPNGTASATQGQHQAYFPGDIYSGQIELVTPDGVQMHSRPMGLSYFDGTNFVLIAELTNSIGVVPGTNQVIYPNAFTDFKADLVYTYKKSGFEQDIVLREQPPTPESFGLNSQNTRLQVLTEFFDTTEPAQAVSPVNSQSGLTDTTLGFGQMQMVRGKAFTIGNSTQTTSQTKGVPVYKSWQHVDGRTFLLEELPVQQIETQLKQLPLPANANTTVSSINSVRHKVSTRRLLTPVRLVQASTNNMQLARIDTSRKPSVVLDYVTIVSTPGDFTFQGDTTYFVDGECDLGGTTTMEGGTVVKYASGAGSVVTLGSLVCQTGPYRPAVLTAADDDSVGETISGSTGNPSGYYGGTAALQILNGATTMQSIRAANIRCVFIPNLSTEFSDIQAINCGSVFSPGSDNCTLIVNNGLFSGIQIVFDLFDTWQVKGSQLTVHHCAFLADTGETVSLTNSLLIAVTNWADGPITLLTNAVVYTNNDSGIFQTVGGGNYYLAAGSPYRNAGITNIDPNILADIRTKTTHPPIVYANATISTNTTFSPQAQRDTDAPDLGYHYDPLDYVFANTEVESNVTFTAGTAVGWFRTTSGYYHAGDGIHLTDNAKAIFNGTATALDYWVRLNTVQEQDTSGGYGTGGLTGQASDPSVVSTIQANFLHCSMMSYDGNHVRDDSGYLAVVANNCEFWVGGVAGYNIYLNLTNCFFGRANQIGAQDPGSSLYMQNCTVHGSQIYSLHGGTWPVVIVSCALDGVTVDMDTNDTYCDYNAFTTTRARLSVLGAHDIVTNSFNWQSSWFGDCYLPSNSPLIDAGNTNANYVGLHHFTTQTNQVPETNSIVDIGYHYVATDLNGSPLDYDGDGFPDYLEDGNGDGIHDSGDLSDWTDYYNGVLPGLTIISGNNQSGPLNAFLPQALIVQATNSLGVILTNAPLTFSVTNGLNQLAASSNGITSTSLSLRTDASGYAAIWLFLPTNAPVTNVVMVTATSGTNSISGTFVETEGHVATPVISPGGGMFATYQNVTIICSTTNVVIHYTLDGSNPTQTNSVITNGQSIFVPAALTMKAAAFEDGILLPSAIQTATFTITGGIAAGRKHTLALNYDGTLLAGGSGGDGQLGDGTTHLRTNLVSVIGVSNVVGIAAGELFSYAWKANGTAWSLAWGDNRIGEMGNGTVLHQQTNALQITNLTAVIQMAGGNHHGLAVETNGTVWAWGLNDHGQLGDGTVSNRWVPVQVTNLTSVIAVAGGGAHSLALKSNGTVWGWGHASGGQLGDGTVPILRTIPVRTVGLTNVTAIAAGNLFSLALSNGMVWAWGDNGFNELGDGTTLQRNTPVQVTGLSNVVAIAAGSYHSLALKSDGTFCSWGKNDSGQLGDCTIINRSHPVQVGGLSNVVAIAAGGGHSVALKSDGTIVTWGYSNYGEEGDINSCPTTQEPSVHLTWTINFSISFPNQYVSTNIVSGVVTVLSGIPSYFAVLVDSTNFTTATWMAYTSSTIPVNLGSTQGSHDVWVGLRGLPAGAQQTWEETTLILGTNSPTITITNPVNNVSFNADRVDISGNFTATSLKQITVNDVQAFINGTNFEAVNVPLIAGTNVITAVIEDLTGLTNVSSINVIGLTNSDGSLNDPVDLQATPVAGFAPLTVTFSLQANVPGTTQQVSYDFNGDDLADFVTNNLNSVTYTYATNGEYLPVVTIQTTAGRFSSIGGWNAVALDPSNQPVQINVQSPPTTTVFASITDPVDIKWVSPSNLYVLSGSTATITEFSTNGSTTRSLSGIGTNPSGFDVDAVGNVYVTMTGDNQVWKFYPTNATFAADASFGNGGYIGMFDGDAGVEAYQFKAPFDVAVSPDGGTISISDSGNNQIQQYSAAGKFIVSFGSSGSDVGQFNTPEGLTYDSVGNLYIVDSGNDRIAVAQNSEVLGVSGTNGTALGQFSGPVNISVGERGVYVADTGNNRIQSFNPPVPDNLFTTDSSAIRFAISSGLSAPAAVAVVNSLTNEMFYVADTGNNRVILCNVPAENSDPILGVWDSMTNHVVNGDIPGAISYFSVASSDKYRQAFLSVGTANTISAINQIGTLTPDYIGSDEAEFYFQQVIDGQTITFPVKFDKENGVWKILEF